MIEPCRVDISRPVTSLILSGGCWVEMADLARGNLLVRLLGGLVLKVLPELCGTKSWSHGRLYLSPQTRPNKLDTCQQNNLNFIIHVTACNPFVFLLCGKYNQISGSTVTLNYSVYPCQPIFHLLGKSHCLIPLSGPHLPPPPPSFSHITKWSSFALPWSYSTGQWIFNVRKADLSSGLLKYSKNEKKTPSIFQPVSLMVCQRDPQYEHWVLIQTPACTDAGTQCASLWTAAPCLHRQRRASGP